MDLRQKASLLPEDDLVAAGKGEFRVLAREAAWRRAQELARELLRPAQSVVDEFLMERRREEELDIKG